MEKQKQNSFLPFSLERLLWNISSMKESDLIADLAKDNIKKDKENKLLREALEFYANGEHCKEAIELDFGNILEVENGIYEIEGYYPIEVGSKAKQALGE